MAKKHEKWTELIQLREARNLTQMDVARAIGMSRSGFSMYEVGQREPDLDMVRKMADFFNVTTDYLLGRATDPAGSAIQPIPPEWQKVIAQFRAQGLSPEKALKALAGLSMIEEALSPDEPDEDKR